MIKNQQNLLKISKLVNSEVHIEQSILLISTLFLRHCFYILSTFKAPNLFSVIYLFVYQLGEKNNRIYTSSH